MAIRHIFLALTLAATAAAPARAQYFDPTLIPRLLLQTYQMALSGDPTAQARMGQMLELGLGMPRDPAGARRWYELSASQKDPMALYRLGRLLIEGNGMARDSERGARLLTSAAEMNVAAAQVQLASLLEVGQGVPASQEMAVMWLRKAADMGDVAAQIRLAEKYVQGRGVPVDLNEAVRWYEKAAESGNRDAQARLGELLVSGRAGLARDPLRGGNWLALAAGQGHGGAMQALGKMFEDGDGVPRDIKKAIHWYGLGAAAGDKNAWASLERLSGKKP
jgi:TPR repeat protein